MLDAQLFLQSQLVVYLTENMSVPTYVFGVSPYLTENM